LALRCPDPTYGEVARSAFVEFQKMHRLIFAAVGVMALAASGPASAGGVVEGAELEHARANARAGGPVSERDAELLERYGCSSGTRSAFCEGLSYRKPWRRSKHRRAYRY
jgi:hypothetical protein